MSSKRGRGKRHAHKTKRPDSDKFTPLMAHKTCVVCGKQCYPTRKHAAHSARVNHPGRVMHVYWCEEPTGKRWWHLSSIPADKLKKLRDKEHAQADGVDRGLVDHPADQAE